MSLTSKKENWLLVAWSDGGRDVVYVRSVLSPLNELELKIGGVLTANRRGEAHTATLIARARERHLLDAKIKEETEEAAGPSTKGEEGPADFSASASSWEPSDDGALSDDSDKVAIKRAKLETCRRQYSNRRTSKKVLTPCNKVNAVIPKSMQQQQVNNYENRKRAHKEINKNVSANNSLPDSTRRYKNPESKMGSEKITVDVRELISINNSFRMLFNMLEDLKRESIPNYDGKDQIKMKTLNILKYEEPVIQQVDEDKAEDNNESEEFNRSDDNVLITNKYDNQYTKQVRTVEKQDADIEWVPIGSGKTLIHMDHFKKVNWRSYTIATRTLLLAVFPRSILATHSLTGKRSPAFQDKPAKMCLDPKIISDVIMEIMDRFNVKENLVRSIITTKCADECKMWKTRIMKKFKPKNPQISPKAEDNLEIQQISL